MLLSKIKLTKCRSGFFFYQQSQSTKEVMHGGGGGGGGGEGEVLFMTDLSWG